MPQGIYNLIWCRSSPEMDPKTGKRPPKQPRSARCTPRVFKDLQNIWSRKDTENKTKMDPKREPQIDNNWFKNQFQNWRIHLIMSGSIWGPKMGSPTADWNWPQLPPPSLIKLKIQTKFRPILNRPHHMASLKRKIRSAAGLKLQFQVVKK